MKKPQPWGWLLILTSSGTLLCCALPIALVSLGFGATVAGLASAAPWLIALSQHKAWLFSLSAVLVVIATFAVYRPGRSCPADPDLAAACARADEWNRRFIVVAGILWLIGFVAAYGLPLLVSD